ISVASGDRPAGVEPTAASAEQAVEGGKLVDGTASLVATRATCVWSRLLRVRADQRMLQGDDVQIRAQGEEQGGNARDEGRRKRSPGGEAVGAKVVRRVDVRAWSGELNRVRTPVREARALV